MSGPIYYKDNRRVLPKIEKSKKYFDKGKLSKIPSSPSISEHKIEFVEDDLSEKIAKWKKNKTELAAGEILSHAIITGKVDDVEDIKSYLINKRKNDSVIKWITGNSLNIPADSDSIDHNFLKLKLEPKDALTWTDQAINFLFANQIDDAEEAIENALSINSDNGFITRIASRFFHLFGDINRSIQILKKSKYYKIDPQILSAEISYSQLDKRKTQGGDIGSKIISANKYSSYQISELAGAIGTGYYVQGNYRKSEDLFDLSLIDPNENSVAQSLWYKKNPVESQKIQLFNTSAEIQAHNYFKKGEFEKTFEKCIEWMEEEPFSSRPFRLASYLSSDILHDYSRARKIMEKCYQNQIDMKGSISSDEASVFNNDLAYYLLIEGKVQEAEKKYLESSKELIKSISKPSKNNYVQLATLGLWAYKTNQQELGSKLYRRALQFFATKNLSIEYKICFFNYFKQEIEYSMDKENLGKLYKEFMDKIPDKDLSDKLDLKYQKEHLIKSYNTKIATITD